MRITTYGITAASILFLANFGDKSNELPILAKNYFGTIKLANQEKPIPAEKITIAQKNNQIQVYSKPTLPEETKEHILKSHPRDCQATTYLNFDNIASIAITQPPVIWTYKKNDHDITFVEIQVTSKESGNVDSYIIEPSYKIYYGKPDASAEIKQTAPIMALEKITFDGCRTKESLSHKKKAPITPCDVTPLPSDITTKEPVTTNA